MTSEQKALLVSLAKAQLEIEQDNPDNRSVFSPGDPEFELSEDLVKQGYAYVLTWGICSNLLWVQYQVSCEGWDLLESFNLL